ncbi:MAG: DUF3570 domain-containing protein [Bdellovibrionaceae bacterium]|nr:DUF3570 domain-containing protein [Pseudobdellovibrionaceae bacterium]
MQLRPEKKRRIGKLVANASLSLLCMTTSVNTKAEETKNSLNTPKQEQSGFFVKNYNSLKNWAKWKGQAGFLNYSESDGRIQVSEAALQLSAEFENERVWTNKLVFDSLTGASPNGAINSNQPQTFTTPSGKSNYTVNPGEIPLFQGFKDTRVNISSTWSQPISRLWKIAAGFNGSNEYDYLSLGLNTMLTKESEDKNSTYSLGFSFTQDTIDPVGGVPTALASIVPAGSPQPRSGVSENKTTLDFLLGYTQVMSRSWLIQTNVSLGLSSGYMNDPYKVVTVFDNTPGPSLGNPLDYIYENRPDTRFKRSFYIASKNDLNYGILTTSYRFLNDDWGLSSHTFEGTFNFGILPKWRLEPGFRLYLQSAVDFYKYALANNATAPLYITADNRLGDMTTIAPALKIIRKLEDEKELSLILRYYLQTGDSSPSSAVGSQIGQDLFPNVSAFIIQLHYSF